MNVHHRFSCKSKVRATCYDRYGWTAFALVVVFRLVTGTLASDRMPPTILLKLYFVRHGETLANTLRHVVGQSDSVR